MTDDPHPDLARHGIRVGAHRHIGDPLMRAVVRIVRSSRSSDALFAIGDALAEAGRELAAAGTPNPNLTKLAAEAHARASNLEQRA